MEDARDSASCAMFLGSKCRICTTTSKKRIYQQAKRKNGCRSDYYGDEGATPQHDRKILCSFPKEEAENTI